MTVPISRLIQDEQKMVERKIRYDGSIAEYDCVCLTKNKKEAVLLHEMRQSFSMPAGQSKLTIPVGSVTIAHYWIDRPYNLYLWRDRDGSYLGSYFNIVRNTRITSRVVSFEDLILDVLVLPDGRYFLLDEDELPLPLDQFEGGTVRDVSQTIADSLNILLPPLVEESGRYF